jgi:hypothetical protein
MPKKCEKREMNVDIPAGGKGILLVEEMHD